jgi:hypothetical protein
VPIFDAGVGLSEQANLLGSKISQVIHVVKKGILS